MVDIKMKIFEVYVSIYSYIYIQAFILALLSTAVFPQRLSFFTVCLNSYLYEVLPWWASKWKLKNESLGFQVARKFISDTLFHFRSIACTSFSCSNSDISWNFRVSWGVLWDWVFTTVYRFQKSAWKNAWYDKWETADQPKSFFRFSVFFAVVSNNEPFRVTPPTSSG